MLRGLVKGDNVFVPTAALRVTVRSGVDVAALLVTEQGRVRGDADIVFDGAPAHPSGAVRLSGGADGDEGGTVRLDADLAGVEEGIARVLVVASTEEGALRDARGLSVEVSGPDGGTIVAYEVTDAGSETAMVLAELYRRSGGWKFRAVGQGYADGLEGLAVDHGVDVTEERPEPAPQPPPEVPEAPQPPAPRPAPPQAPAKTPEPPAGVLTAPAPVPVPAPVPLPASVTDRAFGAFFEPHTLSGQGSDVITVEDLPPGPVVVELAVRTDGYTGVWTLTPQNKNKDLLVNSTEKDFRGRLLVVPEDGPLRLKLRADGPWQARVLPLAAARRLTEDTLESWGPDVLLHTGGTTDVAFHYRGDSNFIVDTYALAGHDDPATLPKARYPYINEIGRRREALALPEGPVLVHLRRADGPWRARLRQPSAVTGWIRRARR
ncbi:TerD family protein [Streptomyces sp. NPDC057540]|uniref:TerD family protein n=1 Tax=Streptomyces sp. NPDC057540 TaxID=3346160 RepID=UPI0036C88797